MIDLFFREKLVVRIYNWRFFFKQRLFKKIYLSIYDQKSTQKVWNSITKIHWQIHKLVTKLHRLILSSMLENIFLPIIFNHLLLKFSDEQRQKSIYQKSRNVPLIQYIKISLNCINSKNEKKNQFLAQMVYQQRNRIFFFFYEIIFQFNEKCNYW